MKNFSYKHIHAIFILLSVFACEEERREATPKDLSATFQNPVLTSSPDPWVIYKDDMYYVTYTTGNSLRLIRTQQMSDVSQGQAQTIWTPPASGSNSKNIWAPELHFINNKWYFYYAADDGVNEHHRMFVLENENADPFTGTWVDKGEVVLPDDRWAIDGTVTQINGQLYFLWSGWEAADNIQQNIYLCKMSTPWLADGARVMIAEPEFPWEKNGGPPFVNEAPQWLVRDGNIFVTFSASGCWTDQYAIGLLQCANPENLLDKTSWSKFPTPVFTQNASSLAFGPGHNSFFRSKDGSEDWLTYHANNQSGQGCSDLRSMRMQKFTWQNGQPVFGQPIAVGLSVPVPSGEN